MRVFEDISFDSPPTLFAAWPGMGNVGLIAMDYLRRKLGARSFAEIDMSPFFIPESIVVKDGLAQLPDIPSSIFTYKRDPNVIIFESNAQTGGRDGIAITKTILDLMQQFKIKRIFTAAAYAQSISHEASPSVYVACNGKDLMDTLRDYGVSPMPDGYIAGLNGLMLGVARTRDIDAACFLGTIPSYAVNLTYPKASLEILKVFGRILQTEIDFGELEDDVEKTDQQLAMIEDRIKQFFPNNTENDEEIAGLDEERVPHYIMEKIEQLFKEAETDRNKANELKAELDRWNLFELYEDRFLDLFDENRNE